jgi:hypothetical protein
MNNIQTHILDCTTCLDSNTNNTIDDQLILEINDIDDLAIAWITSNTKNDTFIRIEEDKNGNMVPLDKTQWLWRKGGQHGNGKVNITQWLLNHFEEAQLNKNDSLYLVIAVYDFKYTHPLFKGGKWSFDATLTKNGQSIWHKHDFEKSDNKNEIYGLKYLKILQLQLTNKQINISETIPNQIAKDIFNTVTKKYNYVKAEDLNKEINSNYTEPILDHIAEKENKGFFNILYKYIFDVLFSIVVIILSYSFYKQQWVVDNLSWMFIGLNIFFLFYFFIRFKIGGMAWALVLRKKHNRELDTFMVVLGLLFTAAFGAITSFDFEASKIQNSPFYIIEIFSLYISTNIILLYVLVVIETYAINTLKANKQLFMGLMFLVGLGIFIQEYINFEQSYKENISKVEICGKYHATKR